MLSASKLFKLFKVQQVVLYCMKNAVRAELMGLRRSSEDGGKAKGPSAGECKRA